MPARLPNSASSYSTATVARRLGVSTPTVQRWVDQGRLKAWKTVGGHRRIDAVSVQAFIASHNVQEQVPELPPHETSVLIVDDNPNDRDLLATLVEMALPGVAITVAENGFEGLIRIGRQRPDILITDIVMPHMNGVEMLRHLATQPDSLPSQVIAVSSKSREQFAALGSLPAAVNFVPKPIDSESLVALLQNTQRTPQALRRA